MMMSAGRGAKKQQTANDTEPPRRGAKKSPEPEGSGLESTY
jgi:hypothetical protein